VRVDPATLPDNRGLADAERVVQQVQASPIWRFRAVTSEAEQRRIATDAWGPGNPDVRTLGTHRIGDVLWVEIAQGRRGMDQG
jgi:hypothetical protein